MRATALLIAGSCLLASVLAVPATDGPANKGLMARKADHRHPNECWQDDCDTDDDGWDTENDCPTPGWEPPSDCDDNDDHHPPCHPHPPPSPPPPECPECPECEHCRPPLEPPSEDDCSDDDEDDYHHYPHPEVPPTCPGCPTPSPECKPGQSIRNPGFEDNGGTLAPWASSDLQTVVIDSTHGEPDARGSHSALILLNSQNTAASISQHIEVCPHAVYRIYLAIRITALNTPASTLRTSGGLLDNADCTIFTGLRDAGNATIPGASLTPGAYTDITTGNTFTAGDYPRSKVYVAISCAPSAFNSSVPAATFYIDNVQLLPEPQH